jgi:hypothetical protein
VEQTIPLKHVVDVLREPVMIVSGERYFVVAQAWAPADLAMIDFEDDAFGYALIRIDAAGKGLPREYAQLNTLH